MPLLTCQTHAHSNHFCHFQICSSSGKYAFSHFQARKDNPTKSPPDPQLSPGLMDSGPSGLTNPPPMRQWSSVVAEASRLLQDALTPPSAALTSHPAIMAKRSSGGSLGSHRTSRRKVCLTDLVHSPRHIALWATKLCHLHCPYMHVHVRWNVITTCSTTCASIPMRLSSFAQLPLEASAVFSRPVASQKARTPSGSLGSGSAQTLHDTGSLLVPERLSWDVMQRGRDSKHNMTEAGIAAFKVVQISELCNGILLFRGFCFPPCDTGWLYACWWWLSTCWCLYLFLPGVVLRCII